MAEVTYPFLRGFILPDPEITVDRLADPLPPQANPEAGTVTHVDPTSALVLETSGEQSTAWDAEVTLAGMPGVSSLSALYREEGSAASADGDILWNPPNVLTAVRAFEYKDSGDAVTHAGAAVYPDTEDILIVSDNGGRVWDSSAKAWVGALGHAPAGNACIILPSGLALIFNFVTNNVHSYDLATDTSQLYSPDALGVASFAGAIVRASAAEQNGNIVIFVDDGSELFQLASSDVGATFSLIMQTSTNWDAGASVVLLRGGRFMVVYRNPSEFPRARVIADPFEPFDNAEVLTIHPTLDCSPRITACADADGIVYVFCREDTTGTQGALVRGFISLNGGDTWGAFTSNPLNTGEDNSCLLPFACTRHRGQIALIGGFVSQGSGGFNFDSESLLVLFMGGWESLEMDTKTAAFASGIGRIANPVGSGDSDAYTWYATDFPDAVSGITESGPGSRSMETSSGGVEYLHLLQETNHEYQVGLNNSVFVRWEGFVAQGGSDSVKQAYLHVDTANKGCEIWMSRTGFTVRTSGGTSLGGDASYPITEDSPVQFVVHMAGLLDRDLTVLYKRPWETKWSTITAVLTLSFGDGDFAFGTTSTNGPNFLGTNHFVVITAAATSRKWIVRTGVTGANLDSPSGKFLGVYPYPLGDLAENGGVTYLRAKDGPGITGEVQTLALAHRAPVYRIFYNASPSPDESHKTGVETEVIYEWDFGTDLHLIGNTTSGGAFIANPTWRTAVFEYFLGTYQTAAEINMSEGMESLSWVRYGSQIRFIAGTGERYVRRNEYAGGYFHFDTGEVRRIVSNTEGTLGASGRIPRLQLAGTMPAGISGTQGRLCARTAVMVWHELRPQGYTKYRLRIPAQTTAGGSIDTGLFVPGGLVIPGRQYSRGYTRERLPNASVIVDTQGTSRATRRGRSSRRWAIAYSDGLILRSLQGANPSPDYISARAGTDGIATRHDIADLYDGLVEEAKSGETPLVFLPDIPLSTGVLGSGDSYKQIHGLNSHLYCRMGSSVRFEHQEGKEGTDEMGRLQVIALNEVV